MAKNILKDILLDEAGVDEISNQLQIWLEEMKTDQRNITRLRLAMEDLLEDLCIHYDRRIKVTLSLGKRLGTTHLSVHYTGDSYTLLPRKRQTHGQVSCWRRSA